MAKIKKENMNKITKKKYDELVEQLKELNLKFSEIVKRIGEAKQQGDLSENADYSAAREEQGFINSEIERVNAIIESADIISENDESEDSNFNKDITIEINGIVQTYKLLGTHEADPNNYIISTSSPIGAFLETAKVGDENYITTLTKKQVLVKVLDIK
ncbi:MAG: GreA/GreB family elongation factor [Acholeplasmatales bacterium]|jgi:transcription elongation factor GreA|nr:GreA/GreB family elongation factor [Acholeplasmatales bacterium]